jgi:hypothetical protein
MYQRDIDEVGSSPYRAAAPTELRVREISVLQKLKTISKVSNAFNCQLLTERNPDTHSFFCWEFARILAL